MATTTPAPTTVARGPRIARALLPAALLPAQLLLIGPAVLLAGNPGELTQGYRDLLPLLLVPFVAVWALLLALAVLVPARFDPAVRALLLGLGVAAWASGSLLVGDYGVLDGREIDWSVDAGRRWLDALVWLGIPALALLSARRLAAAAGTAAGALLLVQTIGLASVSPTAPQEAEDEAKPRRASNRAMTEPPAEIFQFSRDRNALLLLLDAFQSDVFAQLVDEQSEGAAALREAFDGFTFFADHVGAFPNTRPSIPALLSGRRYDNDEPLPGYYQAALDQSIAAALGRAGWDVDMVSMVGRFIRRHATHRYRLPRPFAGAATVRFAEAAHLTDLSLFRHAPRSLKPWIYNGQRWRIGQLSKLSRNVHHSSNGREFLTHFIGRATVARDAPVWKLVHVGLPHLPAVVDATCAWTDVRPASRVEYVEQVKCAVRLTTALLEKLRQLDIYDSMLIVIAADHGTSFLPLDFEGLPPEPADMPWVVGRALPLLLVKPPGARGPLEVSHAPTAITDVPATIAQALGLPPTFPGTPVFDLPPDAERSRRYDAYYWERVRWPAEYFPFAHRFAIEGPVRSADSWRYLGTRYAQGTRLDAGRIRVGDDDRSDQLGLGWSSQREHEGERLRWVIGDQATVQASLGPGALRLRARLMVPSPLDPQTIEVAVDGRPVATWKPAPGAFVELDAAVPEGQRPPISTISLRFEQVRRPGPERMPVAALVSWLEIAADG